MQDTSVPEAPQVHLLHSILLAPPQGIFFMAQGVICTPICSAATVRALCTRPNTGETALLPRVVQHTGSGCSLLLERSHLQPCMFFQVLRWRVEHEQQKRKDAAPREARQEADSSSAIRPIYLGYHWLVAPSPAVTSHDNLGGRGFLTLHTPKTTLSC